MSNIPISSLPIANPLSGEEDVPLVQAGTTKRAAAGAISALPFGQGTSFASGISFITVTTSSAALPSSRVLAAASPVTLTDAGTGNTLTIGLSFTPGSGTVTSVGLSGGTTGLTVSNTPITVNGTMTLGGFLRGTAIATATIFGTAIATASIYGTAIAPASIGTDKLNFTPGTGSVTSVALSATALGLTVTGSPITGAGTLTLGGFLNGTAIATASITSTQVATNTLGFSKLQQAAGLSLIGVTGASPTTIAPIVGGARQIPQVNAGATALTFGPVGSATVQKTVQAFGTAGVGTYTPTSTGIKYIMIGLWGAGGGGGGGSGTTTGGGNGSSGGQTIFGSFTANGGSGGVGGGGIGNVANAARGGIGGAPSAIAATTGISIAGIPGTNSDFGLATFAGQGGMGGGPGGGNAGFVGQAGANGTTSGGGGGGGSEVATAGGAGGGSGAYLRAISTTIAPTAYTVGAGGNAGPRGTGVSGAASATGGIGGAGMIFIEEYYV